MEHKYAPIAYQSNPFSHHLVHEVEICEISPLARFDVFVVAGDGVCRNQRFRLINDCHLPQEREKET